MPKIFDIERAGVDFRVYIIDNHRPIHLANIYSRTNIVCLVDEEFDPNDDTALPEDGPELSAIEDISDSDDSSDQDENDDDDVCISIQRF